MVPGSAVTLSRSAAVRPGTFQSAHDVLLVRFIDDTVGVVRSSFQQHFRGLHVRVSPHDESSLPQPLRFLPLGICFFLCGSCRGLFRENLLLYSLSLLSGCPRQRRSALYLGHPPPDATIDLASCPKPLHSLDCLTSTHVRLDAHDCVSRPPFYAPLRCQPIVGFFVLLG